MARTQDEGRHPTIFLSYAHDDDVHTSAVLDLATFLETRGFAVAFDVWNTGSRQDWYAWMLREIQTADFVIVVASPRYRAVGDGAAPGDVNRGVQAETAALRDLLYRDRATWLGRVLPVVLPGRSLDEGGFRRRQAVLTQWQRKPPAFSPSCGTPSARDRRSVSTSGHCSPL